MSLTESALPEIAQEIDFLKQPPMIVQGIAEKSVAALATLAATGNSGVDLNQIRQLVGFEKPGATATKN